MARSRGPGGSFGGKNYLRVNVGAFNELRAEIAAFEAEIPGVMQRTEELVATHLIERAKRRAGQLGHVAPKAAESLRTAGGTARSIRVIYGGDAFPYAMGAEFGSNYFRQFRSFRRAGYFVGQAAYETEHYDMYDAFYRAFTQAVDENF